MENKITSSDAIEDLLIRGVNLMRLIEPAIDKYSGSNVDMVDVRKKYNIWRIDIKDEIQRNNIDQVAASYFWQPDGVPLIDGGIEYSDVKSERSQEMLKKIHKQIGIKNDNLRKLAEKINTKSGSPFRETKDDDTTYSFRIKKRTFTFDKSTLQYQLIKYMVSSYDKNIYYHEGAINYIKENFSKWEGRLSSIIQNINDSNTDIKFKLIEISKKGKTFKFNDELIK